MKKRGDAAVVHGLRGKPSNRRVEEEIRKKALVILQQPDWHDFGPTFASQQLAKRHEVEVSKETVRTWMIAAGLWKSRPRKLKEVHCWRARRSSAGELVQWDTSTHDPLRKNSPTAKSLIVADERIWARNGTGYRD